MLRGSISELVATLRASPPRAGHVALHITATADRGVLALPETSGTTFHITADPAIKDLAIGISGDLPHIHIAADTAVRIYATAGPQLDVARVTTTAPDSYLSQLIVHVAGTVVVTNSNPAFALGFLAASPTQAAVVAGQRPNHARVRLGPNVVWKHADPSPPVKTVLL